MQCVVSPHCQELLPALRSPILAQMCSKTRFSLDVTTTPWPAQHENTRPRHGITQSHALVTAHGARISEKLLVIVSVHLSGTILVLSGPAAPS